MDFFERLTKRALSEWAAKSNDEDRSYGWSPRAGIDATIEALKEMMVGEPIRGILKWGEGVKEDGEEWFDITWVEKINGADELLNEWIRGHHGTDGGEVVVMVLSQGDSAGEFKEGFK